MRIQDDLFRAINGEWLENTEIPDDYPAWGTFVELREKALEDCRQLLEETELPLLSIPFRAFLDEDAIEAADATPLAEPLALIDNSKNRDELAHALGKLGKIGVSELVGVGIYPDDNNPSRYIVYISQAGIGLQDESMYREEKSAPLREAYATHIDKMLEMIGHGGDAQRVLDFETAIASHHFNTVEARDTEKTNNPTTWRDFIASAPNFPWTQWLDGLGLDIKKHPELNVRMPSFFTGAAKVWAETEIETLKAWARWNVVHSFAPYLSKRFVDENFDFYGRTLSGQPEQRCRIKRAVGFVENCVGEELGQLYVERHFPPAYKQAMDKLVQNLLVAYKESIINLDWMSPETKQHALEKLATFNPKIGYPLKWRDYSKLVFSTDDSLVKINAKVAAFELEEAMDRLNRPVDRNEWMMTPQTVNAYYYPTLNEIVFPAAILQPPFFDAEANDAANYGAIGAVIGHEIGHGFDDQGSQYGADGRIENWWTDADRSEFEARTKKLIKQYDEFSPAQLKDDSYRVNGAFCLGENIGDLGGLGIALKAWRNAVENGSSAPGTLRDFFTAWAKCWRSKGRDEFVIQLLTIDPHSPSEFRCNGVVRNMDAFIEEFDVQPGDDLWLAPEDRVTIW